MPSENILWLVVKVCGSVTCNYCVRIDCSDKQRYLGLGCENYSSSNVPTPKEGIGTLTTHSRNLGSTLYVFMNWKSNE